MEQQDLFDESEVCPECENHIDSCTCIDTVAEQEEHQKEAEKTCVLNMFEVCDQCGACEDVPNDAA